MSDAGTIELPRVGGPGSGLGDNWRVIVLNDNHNTFEGVAFALSSTLPGVTSGGGTLMGDSRTCTPVEGSGGCITDTFSGSVS